MSRTKKKRWVAIAAALSALLMLFACNPAPKYSKAPPSPVPTAFKESAPEQFKEGVGWRVARPGDDKIRPKWWEMYNDPQLNALEEQVQVSNQTVAQAAANFRASRALVVSARSQLFPVFGATASYSHAHYPQNSRASTVVIPGSNTTGTTTSTGGTGTTTATTGSTTGTTTGTTGTSGTTSTTGTTGSTGTAAFGAGTFNNFSMAADVSYTLDFWHKIRNTIAANTYSAQASAADVGTALLTTQAELAQDYFEVRALDAQEGILQDTIENYRRDLKLTQVLFEAGIDSDEDVSQAQTQLDTATAQSTDLGVARAQYEHAIATLIGKPAAEFSLAVARFVPKPPEVPVAVPSELLERRPDIAAAERQVAAANAEIGVAKAAYYPNVTLSATGGFQTSNISNWFTWPSRYFSLGPSLSQTLLDFGGRRGAVEQAQASYDSTVAAYRQTILSDFQAVEDNLSSLRILSEEVGQYETAIQSSTRYLDLALTRYRAGIDSYLNVVTAQNSVLVNRETQVQVELRQMVASVSLVMALGGGWDRSQLPEMKNLLAKPGEWAPQTRPRPAAAPVAPANPPVVAPISQSSLPASAGDATGTPRQQR
ncbi:MAG: efflux transporter outer membrane subunit [Acidobacteriaceae bacterium]|nr:efflux transporter outer membrane subunit [Acidobacteriaceae bacterium]